MTLVDYSYSRPNLDQLKAQGCVGVLRYLSYPSGKVITASERDAILSRGLMLGLNWEYTNRDIYISDGTEHAKEALRQAKALKYPAGCAIIFSAADHDVLPGSDTVLFRRYMKNCRAVLGGEYRLGVYGGHYPLDICFNENLVDCAWQLAASYGFYQNGPPYPGNKHPKAAAWQHTLDKPAAGGVVDYSDKSIINPLYIWGEENMPITVADAKLIAQEVWNADVVPSGRPENPTWQAKGALGQAMQKAEIAAAKTFDYDALAQKVVEKLGPISGSGLSEEALKTAVKNALKEIFAA